MFEMVIRFVLLYLVPLVTMAMFYSEIVLHLWKRKAPGVHIEKKQKRIEKQKRKVVTMLVTIVTLFAICWLPAHVNNFLLMFNFKVHSCLHNSLILIYYILNHSNAVINPCLYLVFNESFSEGFKHRNRSKIAWVEGTSMEASVFRPPERNILAPLHLTIHFCQLSMGVESTLGPQPARHSFEQVKL